MIKKVLIVLITAMPCLWACAQDQVTANKAAHEKAVKKAKELKDQVSLTDAQFESVKSALTKKYGVYDEQEAKIKEAEKIIKEAKKAYKEELDTILSSDQKKELAAIKEKSKKNKESEKKK